MNAHTLVSLETEIHSYLYRNYVTKKSLRFIVASNLFFINYLYMFSFPLCLSKSYFKF